MLWIGRKEFINIDLVLIDRLVKYIFAFTVCATISLTFLSNKLFRNKLCAKAGIKQPLGTIP